MICHTATHLANERSSTPRSHSPCQWQLLYTTQPLTLPMTAPLHHAATHLANDSSSTPRSYSPWQWQLLYTTLPLTLPITAPLHHTATHLTNDSSSTPHSHSPYQWPHFSSNCSGGQCYDFMENIRRCRYFKLKAHLFHYSYNFYSSFDFFI